MVEAKKLAGDQDFILIVSEEQTQGKGTRGRNWTGFPGNIFATVGIHRKYLPPTRLALLPLEIGLHVYEEAASRINSQFRSKLNLKWPNDLMLEDSKVGGILIESHGNFLLVGVGVNLAGAPLIIDGGRKSGCLADAGMNIQDKKAFIDGLYQRIKLHDPHSDQDLLLLEWQAKIVWTKMYPLRDREGQPLVKPMVINRQGHLKVRHQDGSQEWLVADYLA